jgi:biopolymer transport protein ExbB
MGMSVWEGLRMGGYFLWPLEFLGLLSLLFFVERFLFLHKGRIRAEPFVVGIKNLLLKGRSLEALTLCQETPGPVAQIVQVAILNASVDLSALLRQTAMLEIPPLERHIRSLYVVGQIAPVVGLVGTTFHFLKGFLMVQNVGDYASVVTFSPCVVAALSITFWSFVLSGCALAGYHFLTGRFKSILFDVEWAACAMIQFFKNEQETAVEPTVDGA